MKRVLTKWAMATALATVSTIALADEPSIPGQKWFNELNLSLARAIYKVMPRVGKDEDTFVLAPHNPALDTAAPTLAKRFVFLTDKPGTDVVECELGDILRLAWRGNSRSAFSIGVCHKQRNRLIGILNQSPKAISTITEQLLNPKEGFTLDKAGFIKAGFYYNKKTLQDGSELHYSPLFFLQNDTLVMESVVLLDKQGAWIVQSQLGHFCGKGDVALHQQHKLCTDTEAVLGEIAQEIRARFPVGKLAANQVVPTQSAVSASGATMATEKR